MAVANGLRFAEFAAELRHGDIPGPAIEQARRTTLDTVGTAIGGQTTAAAGAAAEVVGHRGLGQLPLRFELSPPHAASLAFQLAVSASALDFDDGHYLGGAIHPAAVVVPTLLVAAIGRDVSLDEVVTAQVAGYEVGLRLAHLLWPKRQTDRYHCTGTAGCVAAAVAAARMRGADAETVLRALEIAWCHAPVATLQLPMIKEAIGWAAATAIFAVRLAENGFKKYPPRAHRPPAPDVFAPTPFDEPGACEDPFLASLGAGFESANTYLKRFACCRYTHTAAALLLELIDAGLDPDEISQLRVGTHRGAIFLAERRPPTLEHAQYSFPFVLGSIAVDGNAGPDQITASRIHDRAILDFAGRVSVSHDPEMERHYPARYAASVEIALKAGGAFQKTRLLAPGDREDPLSSEFLHGKFLALAAPAIGPGPAEALLEILGRPSDYAVVDVIHALGQARGDRRLG